MKLNKSMTFGNKLTSNETKSSQYSLVPLRRINYDHYMLDTPESGGIFHPKSKNVNFHLLIY